MKFVYFNYMVDLYGYSIGSTIKAKKLLGALQQMGHSVSFFWMCAQSPKLEKSTHDAKPSSFSLLRDLLYTPKQLFRNGVQFFREWTILRRERPDAVIVRLDAFRISALWACRLRRVPMFVEADGANSYEWLTFNNGRHLWASVLLWCEKIMLKHARGIITQSTEAKHYFCERHNLPEQDIIVITNGADARSAGNTPPAKKLQESLNISQNAQIIGFVGSMHHWHGIQDVQTMIHQILRRFPTVMFLFVGSGGALERDLKEQLQDAGERVLFTGTVPNESVQDYIQLFDIAIAPYPHIDLFYFSPMKIFEYMAAGKPIVTARIGQMARILEDQRSALFYEAGDIIGLQQQIELLIKNSQLRKKIARNAYQSFVDSHTWKHKAEELDRYVNLCLAPL